MTTRASRSIEGKVVLITGAAGGIGSAVARLFASEGAHLALLDVNAAGLDHLAEALRGQGATIHSAIADLRTPEGVKTGIAAVLAPYDQHADVLIANVGRLIADRFEAASAAMWNDAFTLNFFTHIWACQCVVPHMVARGRGCIVFTGSDQGLHHPDGGLGPYAAAKAALHNVVQGLAAELAEQGICVHGVAPGITRTPLVEQDLLPTLAALYQTGTEQAMELELKRRNVPLGRLLEPEEVAQAILYLATAPTSTGTILDLSGGHK